MSLVFHKKKRQQDNRHASQPESRQFIHHMDAFLWGSSTAFSSGYKDDLYDHLLLDRDIVARFLPNRTIAEHCTHTVNVSLQHLEVFDELSLHI